MDGTEEVKFIGKEEELFYLYLSFTIRLTSSGIFLPFAMVIILSTLVELFIKCRCIFAAFFLGATPTILVIACNMSQAVIFFQNRILLPPPVLLLFPPLFLLFSTESSSAPLALAFFAFSVPVEAIFGLTGWFYSPFEVNYLQCHHMLDTRH